MDVRRVITGQTSDGTSVFVRDERAGPTTVELLPGYEFHRIWGSDSVPSLPTDGTEPPHPTYFPPATGFRVGFFTIPADSVGLPPGLDIDTALAELGEKLPGMGDVMEPANPGMHTTDTVDVDTVISGEVWLELDDGVEVHLTAGDVVVQNGTRHAWRNRSDMPCVIAVTLIGATRAGG